LVSSERELKDGNRGDLRRRRFTNAKQSESKTKVHSPNRIMGRLKKVLGWRSQVLKLLWHSADVVCTIKLT
jgi:hypothetical protein